MTRPTIDIALPCVRVIADADDAFIDPYDVDLSDPEQAGDRHIQQCLDPSALNIEVDDYLPLR